MNQFHLGPHSSDATTGWLDETISLVTTHTRLPVYVARPHDAEVLGGVIVIHDALGMTQDVRNHAQWLARSGYLAAAPDLYSWGHRIRCLVRTIIELSNGSRGKSFDAIEATRMWVNTQLPPNHRIGVLGFCMGGGFALALASSGNYDAVSANYGACANPVLEKLAQACPIVASYGERDPTLRGEAARLTQICKENDIPHDIKEYPGAGHGFMNQHHPAESNFLFDILIRVSNSAYDADATRDAKQRILSFFEQHLASASVTTANTLSPSK